MQKQALESLLKHNGRGLITVCTGGGKTKIAIDFVNHILNTEQNNDFRGLIVVPTKNLRDNDWHKEFKIWSNDETYNKFKRSCYISVNKIHNQNFDVVIMDEVHNITEFNYEFFKNNNVKYIVALSATPPKEKEKKELLDSLKIYPVFHLSLDEAVKRKIVSPYKINIIEINLDNKDKYIQAGNKEKRFFITEKQQYEYINKQIMRCIYGGKPTDYLFNNRARFIYNLKSKKIIAQKLLSYLPNNEKTIVFCASKEQAEFLSENYYHSGTTDETLNKFINDEIKILTSINKLNEGINIPNLDNGVVVQLNSKELHLIQRIGRICRFRENHTANIYIISVKDTVDEKWVNKAIESFDKNNINYLNPKNLWN